MTTTDSNGILFYSGTDVVTPLATTLNGISQSVSDAFTADRERLDALEDVEITTVTVSGDSGLSGSFTAIRRNGIVYLDSSPGSVEGTLVGTAWPYTFATLPPGWRPQNSFNVLVGSSSDGNANCRLIGISSGGLMRIVWSGNFGGSAGTGGSGIYLNGVSYVVAS